MKRIDGVTRVLAGCLEVLHWLAVAGMAALMVCALMFREQVVWAVGMGAGELGDELASCGFEMTVAQGGVVNPAAVALFAGTAAVLLGLTAMIFRNVRLILKTVRGETWFAEGGTPFQGPVIRMLREIGIFLISIPVLGLVASAVVRLVLGPEAVELSVGLERLVLGLLVLCLTQAFSYGQTLQREVDGLL